MICHFILSPNSFLMHYNNTFYSYEYSQYWFNFNDDIFITPSTSVSFFISIHDWGIYQDNYDERDIELQYRNLDSDSWSTIATYLNRNLKRMSMLLMVSGLI